jgi:hypothetical protein
MTSRPSMVTKFDMKVSTALAALSLGGAASAEAADWRYSVGVHDDAPRERGYDRSALGNSVFAYAATAKLAVRLGDAWTLFGRAPILRWNDDLMIGLAFESKW